MARPRLPIEETLRWEIYVEYCRFAGQSGTLPNGNTFRTNVLPYRGYTVCKSHFREMWRDLQLDGLIRIDPQTGAVKITEGKVIPPIT